VKNNTENGISNSGVICSLFTAERPFDLPGESETGFTMKLNSGSLLEYSQDCV